MTSLGLTVSNTSSVPKIDTFQFNAMGSGGTAGEITANVGFFILGQSQILGFQRTTPGGAFANSLPYVASITGAAAGGAGGNPTCSITIRSTVGADTSVYTMVYSTPTAFGLLP